MPIPRFDYPFEWDDVAVASTVSYTGWWWKLPQESRKSVRRAAKRGVSVQVARFEDELVKGIKSVYDKTPNKQGKRFWHYRKDFETVKAQNGTYLSEVSSLVVL